MDIQGADRVNDELEVGFDQRFEQRWRTAQNVGRVVMIAFVLACLAGLLGRGPYSHQTVSSKAAGLTIDFEPVARSGTPTQVTLHVDNPTPDPAVRIFVSTKIVEPMGLERILPQPLTSTSAGGGLELTFAITPGAQDAHIRLILQPSGLGPIDLRAQRDGYAPIAWTQTVAP